MIIYISVLFFSLIFLALLLIIITSIRGKGRWGINFSSTHCPKCGNKMPLVRNPTSTRQALWGGWTCTSCGCEMDKWGKEISTTNINNRSPNQLEQSKSEPIKSFDGRGKTPVERIIEENDN